MPSRRALDALAAGTATGALALLGAALTGAATGQPATAAWSATGAAILGTTAAVTAAVRPHRRSRE